MDRFEVEVSVRVSPITEHLHSVTIYRKLINLTDGERMTMKPQLLGMMTAESIRSLGEQLMEANLL